MIYDFHYNYMKHNFGKNAKLLYTDTDRLMHSIAIPEFFTYMRRDIHKSEYVSLSSKQCL